MLLAPGPSVYADPNDGYISHYRDCCGVECNTIVRCPDGRYGLVQIKLGQSKTNTAIEKMIRICDAIRRNIAENPED